jgi:hypothetical protein
MEINRIAGGENDFLLVRHLVLDGPQSGIGARLAEEAHRLGWVPAPAEVGLNRARLDWFEAHWPQHHSRLVGASATLGLGLAEHTFDGVGVLPQACSALWVPPSAAQDGHGRIGRTYDFFTLGASEIMGGPPVPGEPPMVSRPHVITTRPEGGLASTVLTMTDFDGATDGVNAAGLSVVLLIADFETAAPPEDTSPEVGVNSIQLPRFLLDTCEDAEQAERALRSAPVYDFGMPLHYLVADAKGRAFVWEGPGHVIEADGALCVTNHPLHRHPDPEALPEDNPGTFASFGRLRSLHRASTTGPMSAAGLRAAMDDVEQVADPASPMRTLWRTVLDPAERTMSLRFWLGDGRGHSPEVTLSPVA